jgi:predicted DNA-binding ribbon-helix-helix protein
MIRKTMRIGEVRTSIKLEPEFWGYLKEVADGRSIRLSRLVNDVAHATPDRTNLASTLRTFSLIHARLRWQGLERELEKPTLKQRNPESQATFRALSACSRASSAARTASSLIRA